MIAYITKYFPNISPKQAEQFTALGRLYPEWNERINVISRKDINNLYINHILHSLSIAKFLTPTEGSKILDMGTGGGFPGIPLAVMFPTCKFHLIDRIGKKIKVASSIAQEIGLSNVTFQHGDIGECREKYDFVVSRAVMRLNELVPLIKKNISRTNFNNHKNGLVCLKGGDITEESEGISYPIIEIPLNELFHEEFFETKKLIYLPMS